MKDYLLDIVNHVLPFGELDMVKIVGDDKTTVVSSYNESVLFVGKFLKPLADFEGTFGIPNLPKLNILLKTPEYQDNAKLEIKREMKDNVSVPAGIHFENKTGDFNNDFRFASAAVANAKIKTVVAAVAFTWPIEFEPTVAAIQRFKYQDAVNDDSDVFSVKTDGTNLKFYFGDNVAGHAGEFVFQANITGSLKEKRSWNTKLALTILNLAGDKTFRISDQGAIMIRVNSGLIEYEFTLPFVQK